MSRSAGLAAEIRTMDRIERAMALIEDLPEPSQARVRRWVAETYLDSRVGGEGGSSAVIAAAGGRPVPDAPQA